MSAGNNTLLSDAQDETVTVQISNRVINFTSGGLLGQKAATGGPTDDSGKKQSEECVESNLPLGQPKHYYYPYDLVPDSRDLLQPREIQMFRPFGKGLANPGWNTCYFNSILQALTYAPYLSFDSLRKKHQSICKHRRENLICLMCMFEDHVNTMLEDKPDGNMENQPIVSSFIKCAQKLIWRRFRIGVMQDAQEFLRYFLEALHKSCLPKNLQSDQVFRKLDPITASTTYIGHLFSGFFLSRIVCFNCQYISNTYDPFMDIPLDIMGVSTLESAFKLFTKTEYLKGENRYKCPKCNCKSDASKQLLIEKLPPLLTIQLKRFSFVAHGSRKPKKAIQFSETLDLEPFIVAQDSGSKDEANSKKYKLWAVVCHTGDTLSCGHYFTHAKSINNNWYCFNDDYVKPIRIENVLNENYNAYLLFYYNIDFKKETLVSKNQLGNEKELAPDIPLIITKSTSGPTNGSSRNTNLETHSDLNHYLDELLLRGSGEEKETDRDKEVGGSSRGGSISGERPGQNPNDSLNKGMRLVLTPSSTSKEECSAHKQDNRSNGGIIQAKKAVKTTTSRKKALVLFDSRITRSRTRRNYQRLICFDRLNRLGLLKSNERTLRYFDGKTMKPKRFDCRLIDETGTFERDRDTCFTKNDKVKEYKLNNEIDKWEDVELTSGESLKLEEAQALLLAERNIRSDYDREYDKGRVKKPLREKNSGEKVNKRIGIKSMGKFSNVDLSSLSSSELFDIAFKNKGNMINTNKRKFKYEMSPYELHALRVVHALSGRPLFSEETLWNSLLGESKARDQAFRELREDLYE
ncbi:ubiquitin carboxyl-terminal hydrolase of the cysteine proteinase fold [Cryptosporidium felis]|nr:ubiquitin carboxyl-terminal hydrolase of the cysteine proteinase fold [Cryptosporidium felis]